MNVALHPLSLLVAVFDGFGQFCYVDLTKIKKCNTLVLFVTTESKKM
ncbi:hypothetical protein NIES3974_35160 [Calothrix sp. NIES-3974]|nr:hypothetical protein NIES3974_35160 [Calothrix sp. NIES-3974]